MKSNQDELLDAGIPVAIALAAIGILMILF